MSAEANKTVIRRVGEALGRGDMETVRSLVREDCVLRLAEGHPAGGTFVGIDAVNEARARMVEMLGVTSVEVLEQIADGPTRVVGIAEFSGTDAAGEPWSMRVTELIDVVDGKLAEMTHFWFDTQRLHEIAGDRANDGG